VKLDYDAKHGYLESVLEHLEMPASSQMLVFSKTSFQRSLLGPRTPRALYFNDDVYVGFVHGGPVLEIATIDSKQGTVFYTLTQEKSAKPRFKLQTDDCLQCHQSSVTRDIPGLLMRSVYPDMDGEPILPAGTFVSTDRSPLSQRWGGWYVTGASGRQHHMGNTVCEDEDHADQTDFSRGSNVTSLAKKVDTAPYLRGTSDIVALMVLEHQQNMHNLLSQAAHDVRLAVRDSRELNKALGEPIDQFSESTLHRIQSTCEPVVKGLLFSHEARLTDLVKGTSEFAREFAARGPMDGKGRSLRQFDLNRRLFKYPCSYLIYSEQFDGLPAEAKKYIYRRLWEILNGDDTTGAYAHLIDEDRAAILAILWDTKKDLPAYWKPQAADSRTKPKTQLK